MGSRPHGDGVFGHPKRSFSKTLSGVDLIEIAVFTLSCGLVKTELFENAEITVSIYLLSEHALGSLGSLMGILLVCFLLLRFECQFSLSNIEFNF